MDDEQAAPLYIFLKAALRLEWNEEGKEVVENLYIDAAARGGVFNRLGADGEGALEHLLIVSNAQLASKARTPANPSFLLAVILLGGMWFKCAENWDLRAYDRRSVGLYFPDNFRDFSEAIISNGNTHTWQIGFGIWHIEELYDEFQNIVLTRENDALPVPEAHCLCILAAMLFPDRLPLNLESLAGAKGHDDNSTTVRALLNP